MIEHPAPLKPRITEGYGETFGRYRISGVLGHGGMGHLYVAEQRGIEGFAKVVALKRILPHLADTAQFQEMFLNEARIAARLDHPNIVATYELGEVDGKYFMSMEYLPGEDLAAVLGRCRSEQPVPFDIAAMMLEQCAKGLHYAHEMRDVDGRPIGLVHRDVNPINIFVTYHGVVKILDFGVVGGGSGYKSLPGVFKGKYAYCAPEQIEGVDIDRRSDVFSLGIVLWETLTGSRLFNSSTDALTIDAVRSLRIRPPSAVRANVPLELDRIALQALSRDPDRRYQTAQEMSDALEQFLTQRKDHRPSNSIGQWLESLFGSERAVLKKAIAQGSSVEKNLARLRTLDEGKTTDTDGSRSSGNRPSIKPRVFWSTSVVGSEPRGTPSVPGEGVSRRNPTPAAAMSNLSPRASRISPALGQQPTSLLPGVSRQEREGSVVTRAVLIAAGLALVALAAVVGFSLQKDPPAATVVETSGISPTASIEITSRPPGAQVFVDGDPSGLTTPTVLGGLRAGRSVDIRLDLTGYQPVRRHIELRSGTAQKLDFSLLAATGVVRLEGLPRKAATYVDDVAVDGRQPFALSVGTHKLRVETDERELLLSRTIVVSSSGLTVRVPAGEAP